MTIPIEALYTNNRFPSGPGLLFLLLYTPLGIVVFIIRLFISLQLFLASALLPHNTFIRSFVLRVLYSVMGLVVREECQKNRDDTCRVIATNHITPFDHLAVSIVLPCVTPSVYDLPGALSSLLCYQDMGVTQGRETLRANARSYLSDPNNPPLLLHPEGATTSGNLALMKYGTWALELNGAVLVAGIRVWRLPILPVAPSVLGASWAADLCFMLFSPVTLFTIKYVGKMSCRENETPEEFGVRVQAATASALHLDISNHTVTDKVEYMKRLIREAAAAANPMLSPQMHRMAQQVQEVLPHISLDQIKRDLVHTQNVDLTITNFLEGNVPEPIPEPQLAPSRVDPARISPQSPDGRTSLPTASATSSAEVRGTVDRWEASGRGTSTVSMSTAAKTFGKSAVERMTSFETRKAQLIENARRRYIEKHGLTESGYNC